MNNLIEFKILNLVLILLTIYIFFKKNTIYDYGYIKEFKCKKESMLYKYCDIKINYKNKIIKLDDTVFTNSPIRQYFYENPKVGNTIYISYNKNSPEKIQQKSILYYYINKYTSLAFFILIITMILLFKYDV